MRHKQVTASQRQRAEETIDIMETWADGANRRDKLDEGWSALRAEVENPNLRDFEKLLAKEVGYRHPHTLTVTSSHTYIFTFPCPQERAATANGRCETVLTRWFGVQNIWKGYGRKSSGSFDFWVQRLLPRYYNMWQAWYGASGSCHQLTGLWGARGITGDMPKGRVTNKCPNPIRRGQTQHRRKRKKDVYGIFAYLQHATKAINQVCLV